MEGRLDSGSVGTAIYKVIDKLWQTKLITEDSIGLLQLIHDETYPVYLSMKCVDNETTRTNNSQIITFGDLTRRMRKEWEREQEEDPEDAEAIVTAKRYLETMKADITRMIEDAEERMFQRYFATKITTDFLNKFHEGKLMMSDTFLKSLEYVLRSYGISNHKEMIRIALEDVKRFSSDITNTVKESLESMIHIDKHFAPVMPIGIQNAFQGKVDFPSQIIPKKKGLVFFSEQLTLLHPTPNFKMLYSSARDGFDSAKFHQLCDEKGATLTVVRTKDNHIFGGYASVPWSSKARHLPDEHAFLFSWDWKEIYKQFNHHHKAVYHGAPVGPAFGKGDLIIGSDSSSKPNSSMDINNTYFSHGRATEQISGGRTFALADIEVFLVS